MNCFDKKLRPIPLDEWQRLFADRGYRTIQRDVYSAWVVETSWVGFRPDGEVTDPPKLFVTEVIPADMKSPEKQFRSTVCVWTRNEREAFTEHRKALAELRGLKRG